MKVKFMFLVKTPTTDFTISRKVDLTAIQETQVLFALRSVMFTTYDIEKISSALSILNDRFNINYREKDTILVPGKRWLTWISPIPVYVEDLSVLCESVGLDPKTITRRQFEKAFLVKKFPFWGR